MQLKGNRHYIVGTKQGPPCEYLTANIHLFFSIRITIEHYDLSKRLE